MEKTDLRHANNRKANRDLHTELDLWILFVENNEQPLLLAEWVTKGKMEDSVWKLFYAPSERLKTTPYMLTFETTGEFDSARFETIASAKYHLKKSDPEAKRIKQTPPFGEGNK